MDQDDPGFDFHYGQGFCFLQNVQMDSGTHLASYSMGKGCSFPGDIAVGAWSGKVKNEWSSTPNSPVEVASWHGLE